MNRIKNGLIIMAVVGILTALSFAQSDSRKVREELQIMSGILQTTLSFVDDNQPGNTEILFTRSSFQSYYLRGQGALFIVPIDRVSDRDSRELEVVAQYLDQLHQSEEVNSRTLRAMERRLDRDRDRAEAVLYAESAVLAYERARDTVPAPAPVPVPDAPAPTPRSRSGETEDQLRARVAKLQERLEMEQQVREEKHARSVEKRTRIKEALIEALARHGDAMSLVQPAEYVTLILPESGSAFRVGRARPAPATILAVKRSDVSEYKAGRLTLEQFKQKIMEYEN